MNKTIVVTGGTGGIGAGVAEVLRSVGYRVIAATVSQDEIDAFSGSPEIETRLLDVTDTSAVEAFFLEFEDLVGLVNCAGILVRGDEYKIDVFQKVLDVNLTGTMRCCLAAHPALTKNGGAIVNTASMLSTFGGPLVPAYAASKGGDAVDQVACRTMGGGWYSCERRDTRVDRHRNDPSTA